MGGAHAGQHHNLEVVAGQSHDSLNDLGCHPSYLIVFPIIVWSPLLGNDPILLSPGESAEQQQAKERIGEGQKLHVLCLMFCGIRQA